MYAGDVTFVTPQAAIFSITSVPSSLDGGEADITTVSGNAMERRGTPHHNASITVHNATVADASTTLATPASLAGRENPQHRHRPPHTRAARPKHLRATWCCIGRGCVGRDPPFARRHAGPLLGFDPHASASLIYNLALAIRGLGSTLTECRQSGAARSRLSRSRIPFPVLK